MRNQLLFLILALCLGLTACEKHVIVSTKALQAAQAACAGQGAAVGQLEAYPQKPRDAVSTANRLDVACTKDGIQFRFQQTAEGSWSPSGSWAAQKPGDPQ